MNRIDLLASLSTGSEVVCDIGCDHAHVMINAIKYHGVKRGLACDISKGPLEQASKNICNNSLQDKIKTILSDGFSNVNEEFDTAILAGMGGILITNILSKGLDKIQDVKLIIEPNSDAPLVRQYLSDIGFSIIEEYAIYDAKKYYEIIVAIKGKSSYDSLDIKFGPILRRKKPEAFIDYYEKQKKNLYDMIHKITNDATKQEKLSEFRDILEILCAGVSQKYYIEDTSNYYVTYFLDDEPRPTVFISPGGGYQYCSPREMAPVVYYLNKMGYHTVAINYRVDTTEAYPIPQNHFSYAVNKFREDKRVSKFIGLGFSAGGHNLLEVALHENEYNCHFDLIMLAYPVVTANEEHWHEGSFKNLLLDRFGDKKLHKRLSLELEVHKDAPDLFLWGTFTDGSVPVMNSILLLEAYAKNNCNCEYHCYPAGGHGLSTADEASAEGDPGKINPYIQNWINLADKWIKEKVK